MDGVLGYSLSTLLSGLWDGLISMRNLKLGVVLANAAKVVRGDWCRSGTLRPWQH